MSKALGPIAYFIGYLRAGGLGMVTPRTKLTVLEFISRMFEMEHK